MAKSKAKDSEVLEAEVIPDNVPVPQLVENAIQGELKRFDPFEKRISELKEYSKLTITGQEDREGYAAVKDAIAVLRGIRTGTAKDKAIIKKPFWDACAAIEAKAKWIVNEVSAIEDPLQHAKDFYDTEKDRLKQERIEFENRRYAKRIQIVTKLGAELQLDGYVSGDYICTENNMRNSDNDLFDTIILPKFQAIWDEKEKTRIQAEKDQEEARIAFQKQQDDFKKQQEELKRQQDEFEESQKKVEKIEKDKKESKIRDREAQLKSMGFEYQFPSGNYIFGDEESITVHPPMFEVNDTDWDEFVISSEHNIKRIKAIVDEKKAAVKKVEDEKIATKAIEEQKEKDRLIELERQEKLNASADTEKWADFINRLSAVKIPEFKSRQYKNMAIASELHLMEVINLKAKRNS